MEQILIIIVKPRKWFVFKQVMARRDHGPPPPWTSRALVTMCLVGALALGPASARQTDVPSNIYHTPFRSFLYATQSVAQVQPDEAMATTQRCPHSKVCTARHAATNHRHSPPPPLNHADSTSSRREPRHKVKSVSSARAHRDLSALQHKSKKTVVGQDKYVTHVDHHHHSANKHLINLKPPNNRKSVTNKQHSWRTKYSTQPDTWPGSLFDPLSEPSLGSFYNTTNQLEMHRLREVATPRPYQSVYLRYEASDVVSSLKQSAHTFYNNLPSDESSNDFYKDAINDEWLIPASSSFSNFGKDKFGLGEEKGSPVVPAQSGVDEPPPLEQVAPVFSLPTFYQYIDSVGPTDLPYSRPSRNVNSNIKNITWPIKKVCEVQGNITLGGLMMVHEREDIQICGPIMPQGGIQALEAMLHTIDHVNSRDDILPGITLGAYILDDCDKDTYGLEQSIDFIKGNSLRPIRCRYTCHNH